MAAYAFQSWSTLCRGCCGFSRLTTRGYKSYRAAATSITSQQKKRLYKDSLLQNVRCFQRSKPETVRHISSMTKQPIPRDVESTDIDDSTGSDGSLIEKVKEAVTNDQMFRRIFSVVSFGGRQFKIATNDIIMVHKIPAKCGDKIRLQKILMVGGKDFSLIGKPLLSLDQVYIEATVLEKTRGRKVIVFKKKRRKNYKRWRGHRQDLTVLRINKIKLNPELIDVSSRDQV